MKKILLLSLLALFSQCVLIQDPTVPRVEKALLTDEYAKERKSRIDDVRYELSFDLTDKEIFQGTTALQFSLSDPFYLTLDFTGGDVQELLVNGEKVTDISYNGFFIEIPRALQKKGKNSVLVKYTHPYSQNGVGLYRYEDVVDGRSYLYSDFQPYDANQVFPCFDQPNLKARYTTQVLAPKGWHVLTSVRETEKVLRGQNEEWFFPMSEKFSTYTYSLHAGEYFMWESEAKTKNHSIPLRLFARHSIAEFVKTEDWFTWTKQGFQFFEDYFSYPYAYKKYDQLIVPDFNSGAMENIAAVTFNEDRYVSKGEKTRAQRRRLAATLFHELAHMWFGNLVTMDWWEDTWLSESFATYSAYQGLAKATEFKEIWKEFNSRRKHSAYDLDQSPITHPIAQPSLDTDTAFANFDAITYGKGASVLRQLSFLIGEKSYRKALRNYFDEFAHKNTTLRDFMGAMEKASGRDLKTWEERWLKTAMLNTLEVHFTCQKGRINRFEIFQTGSREYPYLRSHKTKLALFRKSQGQYKLNRTHIVEYSGETTAVNSLVGKACPDIVYPNYEDHDYVSVILDKKSLINVSQGLVHIENSHLRSLLWGDLWAMLFSKKITMEQYLEIVEFNGLPEKNLDIVTLVLENVHTLLTEYYPRSGQPWVSQRNVWVQFFEQAMTTKVYEFIEEPAAQKIWFQALVQLAETPAVLQKLSQVISGNRLGYPLSFEVDQDLRWQILSQLSMHQYSKALALIDNELLKDPSKRGQVLALQAKAFFPTIDNKQKFFNTLTAPTERASLGVLRGTMLGLFPKSQQGLQKRFTDSFYSYLKKSDKTNSSVFNKIFVEELAPRFCDQKSSHQMARFLKKEKNLSASTRKHLNWALYANQRCYQMRQFQKEQSHAL
jgi:aminopeptidase N